MLPVATWWVRGGCGTKETCAAQGLYTFCPGTFSQALWRAHTLLTLICHALSVPLGVTGKALNCDSTDLSHCYQLCDFGPQFLCVENEGVWLVAYRAVGLLYRAQTRVNQVPQLSSCTKCKGVPQTPPDKNYFNATLKKVHGCKSPWRIKSKL